jgi:FkbM family methyltransferase
MGFQLAKMNLRKIGYPIELFFVPFAVVTQFIDQPYRCATPTGIIEAGEGDVVIDAGGCWADTALYFAAKVGKHGNVVSFEFLPNNLKIYQRNLDLNPDLALRIKLFPFPLWSSSDQELFINGQGPATSVGATPNSPDAKAIRTVSIDHLLERGDLNRVDFIKMDIEGAELPALQGAEATLRRFRPKLAISVYHRLSDFWQIAQYLDSLGLGYKLHLRHFTIHVEETVLFARSD